jgi:cytochrome c
VYSLPGFISIYTPGTKMPEQTIGSAQDHQALVGFLGKMVSKK